MGVVGEEKVVDRMTLSPGGARLMRIRPRTDAGFVGAGASQPLGCLKCQRLCGNGHDQLDGMAAWAAKQRGVGACSLGADQPPESVWMIFTSGRKSAMTMVPTTTAMNTIMTGSMRLVMARSSP